MAKSLSRLYLPDSPWGPPLVVFILTTLLLITIVVAAGGDPLVLARVGERYAVGDPNGSEGYDGQFILSIAQDPRPANVAPHLDVPAYRYQRILLPLLARLFSFGSSAAIPWLIPLLGLLAHTAGAWAVGELFCSWGINRWYSLIYAFWAGFTRALVVDLPEPLAYGLVAGCFLALQRERNLVGWLLLGLSLFAKEVTLPFVFAVLVADLLKRRWRAVLGLSLMALLPFVLFQVWLWLTFGQPGLGSGGAMATPFELIPFMGFLRIGAESIPYMLAMLVVFGPTVIWPAVWGVWKSVRFFLAGHRSMIVLALLFNSLVIVLLPFSTYRETGGLLRVACGLGMAVLFFAAHFRLRRVLNYCVFFIVLNIFLLK